MEYLLKPITPEYAKELLDKNTHNRKLKTFRVAALANEIERGRWETTHQGIAISPTGVIIDGQHRLHAIIRANKTVDCYIAFNAPLRTQKVIDCGSLRSVSDQISLFNDISDANTKVSAIRQIATFVCSGQSLMLSSGTTLLFLKELEADIEFVTQAVRGFPPARKSWVIGTLAFAYHADKNLKAFIEKVGSGENLRQGEPAKTLRDWLISKSPYLLKGYKGPAVECVFNITYAEVNSEKIYNPRRGDQGIDHFCEINHELVDLIKGELRQQLLQNEIPEATLPEGQIETDLIRVLRKNLRAFPGGQMTTSTLVKLVQKHLPQKTEFQIQNELPAAMEILFQAKRKSKAAGRGYSGVIAA